MFIKSLRDKGWPVAGFDLGDLYPAKVAVPEQGLLRYKTAMNALREMGYVAVGVGKTEFEQSDQNGLIQRIESRDFLIRARKRSVY